MSRWPLGAAVAAGAGALAALLTWRATRPARASLGAAPRSGRPRRRGLGVAPPRGFRDMDEVHALLRLAAAPPGSIVPRSATKVRAVLPPGVAPPKDYSEEEMHRLRMAVYNAPDAGPPPQVPRFPVGTFRYDDGPYAQAPEIDELREYDLDDPRLAFPEGEPYGWRHGHSRGVAKYARWIRGGSEPPPVEALETEKGSVVVKEGHHRRAALWKAGRRRIKVWVGLTHNFPVERGGETWTVPRGVTHEQARALIRRAG